MWVLEHDDELEQVFAGMHKAVMLALSAYVCIYA